MNPSFDEASSTAAGFYEKANWAGCAQQYYTAAAVAPDDRQATRALLRAAACVTRTGQKESADEAFKLLDKALARGCRDVGRLGDRARLHIPAERPALAAAPGQGPGPCRPGRAEAMNAETSDAH